jgi:hypothetical protein
VKSTLPFSRETRQGREKAVQTTSGIGKSQTKQDAMNSTICENLLQERAAVDEAVSSIT